jgi:hypothetical protein
VKSTCLFPPLAGIRIAIVLVSATCWTAIVGHAQIRINEVQSSNASTWVDELGDFDDWVELYNSGDAVVSLSGWYISDDPNVPLKWQLPVSPELSMAPGAYLILWADHETDEGPGHLGFSLAQTGESILLSSPEGIPEDALDFGYTSQDMSCGRNIDGEIRYFDEPTPDGANTTSGLLGVLSPPLISLPGGLMAAPFEVSVSHFLPEAELRFTLDGTEPMAGSPLFISPITISATSTLQVKAFHPEYFPSLTSASSWLFNAEHDLEIISIAVDEQEFSGPGGIDVVTADQEIRAVVSFFNEAGMQIHQQAMGMRRHALDNVPQHGFRLHARGEYGLSKLHLDVFDIRDYTEYNSLILRNGGNDAIAINGTGLRDPLIQQLFHTIDPEYGMSAYKPVVVYVNGDYRGIYNLRERQDEHWMETMYGISCDEMDFLERTAGEPDTRTEFCGDWEAFDEFEEEVEEEDMSDPQAYQEFISGMNLRNFIDYQATEIFICNQDWLSNNMKFWRTYDEDKWNWVLWDTDWGLGLYYPNFPHGFPDWDALNFALSNWGGWTSEVETELLQNLTENESFVADFATRTADLLNSYLHPEEIGQQLLLMKERIESEVPAHVNRWAGSVNTWNDDVEYILSFATERGDYMRTHFADRFELGDRWTIQLDCAPSQAGYVEVNTIETAQFPWEGVYFAELPVRLKAVPYFGYSFSHWEGWTFSEEAEILVSSSVAAQLTAVFVPVNDPGLLVLPQITEILYDGSNAPEINDWVEIYNPGDEPIVFAGWEFCGDGVCIALPDDAQLAPGEYAVLCRNAGDFTDYYGDGISILTEFPFGLSSASEQISIGFPALNLGDTVIYSNLPPWPVNVQTGRTIELLSNELNNDLGQNWVSQPGIFGSPGEAFEEQPASVAEMAQGHFNAWPNPFSQAFTLDFYLKSAGRAQIMMHDATGRELGVLWSGNVHAGQNTRIFTAHDSLIGSLNPGVYIVSVITENEVFTTRLMRR